MTTPDYAGFAEYVAAEVDAGLLIDRDVERRLKREGVRSFGLKEAETSWFVRGVAQNRGAALQSDLDQRIEQVLKLYLDKKGRLRRRDFEQGTEIYAAWIGEKTDPKQIRKTLKEIMQRNDWKPRRHGLLRRKRWYNKI